MTRGAPTTALPSPLLGPAVRGPAAELLRTLGRPVRAAGTRGVRLRRGDEVGIRDLRGVTQHDWRAALANDDEHPLEEGRMPVQAVDLVDTETVSGTGSSVGTGAEVLEITTPTDPAHASGVLAIRISDYADPLTGPSRATALTGDLT